MEKSRPFADGGVVNAGSVRSVAARGGNLQYHTTKAAIGALTRGLTADHMAEGIRVNAVGPGPIFTPFHARRIAAAGETVVRCNARARTDASVSWQAIHALAAARTKDVDGRARRGHDTCVEHFAGGMR